MRETRLWSGNLRPEKEENGLEDYHKRLFRKKLPVLAGIAAILTVGLAGSILTGGSAKEEGDRLQIVATTTMLYDLAREIAGTEADVTALMGPGIDPHQYQASAGDVLLMQQADVVVYNGLHLEGKMGDLFAGLSEQGKDVICAADGIDPEQLLAGEENPESYDPHIWFDVSLWMEAADYLAARLEEIDPAHADAYRENVKEYHQQLVQLHRSLKEQAAELPQEQRVLITAHDAFRYFGRAYGFEVRGLQGLSTNAEAGTAGVRELAGLIVEREIRAVFAEASVPPRQMEALQEAVRAQGFSVQLGGSLYSDSLGDTASGTESYIAVCRYNMDTIVGALKQEGDEA